MVGFQQALHPTTCTLCVVTLPDPCTLTDLQVPQPLSHVPGPCCPSHPQHAPLSSADPCPAALSFQCPSPASTLFLPPFQVPYLPRMCLSYPPLSPAQPSSDEEEGERHSPPLEVSDGEADVLEPGPGLVHGETGRGAQPQPPPRPWPYLYLSPPQPRPADAAVTPQSRVCVCVSVCVVPLCAVSECECVYQACSGGPGSPWTSADPSFPKTTPQETP